MKNSELFLTENSIAIDLIKKYEYPHEVLPHIKDYILKLGENLSDDYLLIDENVWAHKTSTIAPTASIKGPTIIDENAEIRQCAFIRGGAIVGKNAVVGNSCELKNCILFDNVQTPHYNYVGDSILGYKSHMGAGSITSNVKSDKTNVVIKSDNENLETGLRKVGAFLGDNVEIGCNSVLNPGTVIGTNSRVYPLTSVRGVIPKDSIVKSMNDIVVIQK